MKTIDHPEWFFAWSTGNPYITSVCGWTRKQVIDDVEAGHGRPWKSIYRQGGRVIKCKVMPK